MTSDDEADERRCPVCGRTVASLTVIGPDEAVVSPCGHRVSPHDVDDINDG